AVEVAVAVRLGVRVGVGVTDGEAVGVCVAGPLGGLVSVAGEGAGAGGVALGGGGGGGVVRGAGVGEWAGVVVVLGFGGGRVGAAHRTVEAPVAVVGEHRTFEDTSLILRVGEDLHRARSAGGAMQRVDPLDGRRLEVVVAAVDQPDPDSAVRIGRIAADRVAA